jgi:ABC-2 type transport system ATP-binding protein
VATVAECSRLTVRYGSFVALTDVTLQVPEGCVGLLGPNGAGKSTLLKTWLGFVRPSEGQASVLGQDVTRQAKSLRRSVGYMPEQECGVPGLTGVEFVAFLGELSGLPRPQAVRRAHEVLEYVGLGEARYRPVDTYSMGMRQRVKLAQALVHGPRLLLLDEPTNGLDPIGREEMLALIRDVSKEKGVSVVVSSHLLRDVERTCDHVLLVSGGRLLASGALRDLTAVIGHPVVVELRSPVPQFPAALGDHRLTGHELPGGSFEVRGEGAADETAHAVMAAARSVGAQVRRIEPRERSLEEVFLDAMGEAKGA